MSRRRDRGSRPRVEFRGRLVHIAREFIIDGARANQVARIVEGAALQRVALRRAIDCARWAVRWSRQDAADAEATMKGDH